MAQLISQKEGGMIGSLPSNPLCKSVSCFREEEENARASLCPQLCDSPCGRNQRYSQHFCSQRRGPFLGSKLYMWILNSDATWVDKPAVRWRCNQRASLLSPDSREIVELLAADGESRVSVNVSLHFSPVVIELILYDKHRSCASVSVLLLQHQTLWIRALCLWPSPDCSPVLFFSC